MSIHTGYGVATAHWAATGGTEAYSATHAFGDGSMGAGDAQDAADFWYAALVLPSIGNPGPCAASKMFVGWSFLGVTTLVQISEGTQEGGVADTIIDGTASLGSPPSTLYPAWNPLVISKRTAFTGKHWRGRFYPPATFVIPPNVSINGVIDSTKHSDLDVLWQDTFDQLDGSAFQPALLTSGGIVDPAAPVTAWTLRNVVASQRRRKAKIF